jgi:hypothetical protein
VTSRLQLASEKQGKSRTYISTPRGKRKGENACSYGRAVAKIVCAQARHLSAIRSVLVSQSLRWLRDGYNSIPITLLRTTLHPFFSPGKLSLRFSTRKEARILLIEFYAPSGQCQSHSNLNPKRRNASTHNFPSMAKSTPVRILKTLY